MLAVHDRHIGERTPLRTPIRQQFIECLGVDDRAGQNMGTNFGPFFKHANGQIRIELLQSDRGSEARRAATNDDDVVRHGFACGHIFFTISRRLAVFPSRPVTNCIPHH